MLSGGHWFLFSFPCQFVRLLVGSYNFKVCKSVHHHTVPIIQPTRCNSFPSLLLDVYVRHHMFRASLRPSSGAQQLQQQPLFLPLERGGNSTVGRGRADRPDHDQLYCYHHAPKVKPEAATAVVELLMMDVRTPETCGAVHKRQVTNLGNCCIQFVDLLELSSRCFLFQSRLILLQYPVIHVYIITVFKSIFGNFTLRLSDVALFGCLLRARKLKRIREGSD